MRVGGGAQSVVGESGSVRLRSVQVLRGTLEGKLHGFADGGGASLLQLHPVKGFVDPHRSHLGSRKPLPGGGEGGCLCLEVV